MIGEIVMARIPDPKEIGKLQPRFLRGVFLGKSDASDSYIVACSDLKVRVTRVIRRKLAGSEFCAKDVQEIRALPWALADGAHPPLDDVRALPAMPDFRPGDEDLAPAYVPGPEQAAAPRDERVIDVDEQPDEDIPFPEDMDGTSTPLAEPAAHSATARATATATAQQHQQKQQQQHTGTMKSNSSNISQNNMIGFSCSWPRCVTVSTLDSESSDRGSNPREALFLRQNTKFLVALRCCKEIRIPSSHKKALRRLHERDPVCPAGAFVKAMRLR